MMQYNDKKSTAKHVLLNYLAAILELSIFFFHSLASRLFGVTAYGTYIFTLSIIELIQKIVISGFDKSILREVSASNIEKNHLRALSALSTSLLFTSSIGLFFILVIYLAKFILPVSFYNQYNIGFLLLFSPVAIFSSHFLILVYASMGKGTMIFNLILRGICAPLIMIFSLIFIKYAFEQNNNNSIILSHLVAYSILWILSLTIILPQFDINILCKFLCMFKINQKLIKFSIPLGAAEFLNQAIYRVDVILIGILLSSSERVAHYGACIIISMSISGIRYAFDPVISRISTEAITTNNIDRLKQNLIQNTRWIAYLATPLFVVICIYAKQLLSYWGPSYSTASTALIILAIGHYINCLLGLHQWPIVMSGRSTLDLKNNLITFFINIILNLLLIPKFGIIGAASATALSNFLLRFFQLIEVKTIFRFHGLSLYLFKIFIAGFLMFAVSFFQFSKVLTRYELLKFIPILIVYFLIICILGLNNEDKQTLIKFKFTTLNWLK